MTPEQEERYIVALEKIAEKMPNLCNSLTALASQLRDANNAAKKKE